MINGMGPPVLAAGLNELLGLVFIVVTVVGWIIRTVQGNNQQMPPPVQRPGKRRDERVNDEIDSFLQQVTRNPEQKRPADAVRTNVNRPRPPGGRGEPAGSQRQTPPRPQPVAEPAPVSRRIREENTARPLVATPNLGGSLAQQVREHMSERIAKEASRDVGQDISDSVQKHMGTVARPAYGSSSPARVTTSELFAANAAPTDSGCCGRAESLKRMLRNPESIRQAIIIQEILNRPKCLR